MVEFNFAEDAIEGHISAQLSALTMLKFNQLSFNQSFIQSFNPTLLLGRSDHLGY